MDVTLPADLTIQVERELANGNYRSRDELIEQAVRHLSTSASVASDGWTHSAESAMRLMKRASMSVCCFPARNDWYAGSSSSTPASSLISLCAIRSCASRSHRDASSRNGQMRLFERR